MNLKGIVYQLSYYLRRRWSDLRASGSLFGRTATFVTALGVIGIVSMAAPLGHGLSGQFMLLPIMVTAWAFGAAGALAGAALAAVLSPFSGHFATQWEMQSAVYLAFGGVCAWFATGRTGSRHGSDMRMPSEAEERALSGDRVLESLARTVEARDHQTQGHCRRVARNAVALGRALSLPTETVGVLYWSALLHDLGKIAVPDYILLKNGRLSEEEYSEIRRHPAYGADLLTSVSTEFRPIADVVRAHHERWDGLGYPLGSSGEEIPLLARIIAVVDVFEALTSERPYRSPMPFEQALKYITHGAGSQFDPDIVATFESLVARGVIDRPLEQESVRYVDVSASGRVQAASKQVL